MYRTIVYTLSEVKTLSSFSLRFGEMPMIKMNEQDYIVTVIPIDSSIYRSSVCALFKLNALSLCGYQLGEVPSIIWNDRDYNRKEEEF